MTRYVLVGGGVAAIAAAESIRSLDRSGTLTIVTNDPDGYYSRPGLAYFLTGEIDEKLLFPFRPVDFRDLDIQLVRGEAVRIDLAAQTVEVDPAGPILSVPYDRLLLATGARSRSLHTPGEDLAGVFKLDHLRDARRLRQHARKARTAVVTGGGITALELAEGLAAQRVKVHYVMRGSRFWANVLDEVESGIIEGRLLDEGIQLHHQKEVVEILGKNGAVRGVRLNTGEQIACEIAAYAIGITPQMAVAREAGIRCERGILVDDHMQTSAANLFAAGDVAQIYDPTAGRYLLDSLWSSARAQGTAAGLNMAGSPAAYQKKVSFNVTRLAGLATILIGAVGKDELNQPVEIVRGESESWQQAAHAEATHFQNDEKYFRLMIGEKHILGAVVMGAPQLASPLLDIVREKVDISPIRDQLLAPNGSIERLLTEFQAHPMPPPFSPG